MLSETKEASQECSHCLKIPGRGRFYTMLGGGCLDNEGKWILPAVDLKE